MRQGNSSLHFNGSLALSYIKVITFLCMLFGRWPSSKAWWNNFTSHRLRTSEKVKNTFLLESHLLLLPLLVLRSYLRPLTSWWIQFRLIQFPFTQKSINVASSLLKGIFPNPFCFQCSGMSLVPHREKRQYSNNVPIIIQASLLWVTPLMRHYLWYYRLKINWSQALWLHVTFKYDY